MQRLQQAQHIRAGDGVVDVLAVAAGADQLFAAEHGQLLRERRLANAPEANVRTGRTSLLKT